MIKIKFLKKRQFYTELEKKTYKHTIMREKHDGMGFFLVHSVNARADTAIMLRDLVNLRGTKKTVNKACFVRYIVLGD